MFKSGIRLQEPKNKLEDRTQTNRIKRRGYNIFYKKLQLNLDKFNLFSLKLFIRPLIRISITKATKNFNFLISNDKFK